MDEGLVPTLQWSLPSSSLERPALYQRHRFTPNLSFVALMQVLVSKSYLFIYLYSCQTAEEPKVRGAGGGWGQGKDCNTVTTVGMLHDYTMSLTQPFVIALIGWTHMTHTHTHTLSERMAWPQQEQEKHLTKSNPSGQRWCLCVPLWRSWELQMKTAPRHIPLHLKLHIWDCEVVFYFYHKTQSQEQGSAGFPLEYLLAASAPQSVEANKYKKVTLSLLYFSSVSKIIFYCSLCLFTTSR